MKFALKQKVQLKEPEMERGGKVKEINRKKKGQKTKVL